MTPADIVKRFQIRNGDKFRIDDVAPSETLGLDFDKDEVKELLASGVKRLRDLQERLYADGRRSILIVLQAMDAAGKDSTIEHVMSGVNPQGCEVRSFKAPGPEELKHDFLWRAAVPFGGKLEIEGSSGGTVVRATFPLIHSHPQQRRSNLE